MDFASAAKAASDRSTLMNDTPYRLPLTRLSLLLLIAALAVIWFAPLGLRHLVPSDEGRYAEMAREM